MTAATSDGPSIRGFRYPSERRSRSLFSSTAVIALRKLHPELAYLNEASDKARLVVSEPLGELEGAWNEVPEATSGIVRPQR